MEGRYSLYSQGSCGWTSMKNQEFQEAEIWGNFQESNKDSDSRITKREASVITKRLPTATRMIPKPSSRISVSHESKSVPLNIPDWSRIYGKGSDPNPDDDRGLRWVDEDEDEDGDVVPPHEWVGRSRTSSFSVCEGAGRTLKGRDLSRVRNAVLIRTGFLESNSNF